MTLLVTGAAGFIGFHVCKKYLEQGERLLAVDNLNSYYDVNLKKARLAILQQYPNFEFVYLDLTDRVGVASLFKDYPIDRVIHLAAQVGVRHSLVAPLDYVDSNVLGFTTILEGCRHHHIKHLVYASTSSVYGANQSPVLSEKDPVDHPLVIYAATKRYNELAAHSYSSLYQLPTTGLRFFSVYGPWGRPDMALFKFTKNIIEGKAIDLYNHGNMRRDFTYVEDIAEAITRVLDKPPVGNDTVESDRVYQPDESYAPFKIFNIGRGNSIPLMEFVHAIEASVGKKALINFLPEQDGEALSTHAEVNVLNEYIGYRPLINVQDGVRYFVEWYKNYYSAQLPIESKEILA